MADTALPDPSSVAVVAPDMSYLDAYAELEMILAQLDSDQLDVDAVAGRVERAAALVAHCRAKVSDAKARLRTVTAADTAAADRPAAQ